MNIRHIKLASSSSHTISLSFSSMTITTPKFTTARSANKRVKSTQNCDQIQDLIPGLPNEVAELCLSSIQPSVLYSVCHTWRQLIYSKSFPPFLSVYAILSPSQKRTDKDKDDGDDDQIQIQTQRRIQLGEDSSLIQFQCFDPITSTWQKLPPPPPDPPLDLILRHPGFISRNLPIQSVSVGGSLVLLAATTHHFLPALSSPLVFNAQLGSWGFGPQLPNPRRWCATGVCAGDVYIASGIGSQYNNEVARSMEKWGFKGQRNLTECKWEEKKKLDNVRFSRDAIEAVGFRHKLYMVNVKGGCFAKDGIVYNVAKGDWEAMSDGMKNGWRGPVASMDEEAMYMVDELKGALRRYDPDKDCWDSLLECDKLKGAEQVAAGGGRVCVVRRDGRIVVVDVVAAPPSIWMVDTPEGFDAVAVHILPRMNRS